MAPRMVGWLEVDRGQKVAYNRFPIWGNEQFFLGRSPVKCRYVICHPTISNTHLQIHCIIYDLDPKAGIPPFVYATDFSANGTRIKKANTECTSSQGPGILMGHNGRFLLDDGDKLCLAETITLTFRSNGPLRQVELTPVQSREKQLFRSSYVMTGRPLGAGSYGQVVVAVKQSTQRQVACKIVDLTKAWATLPESQQQHKEGATAGRDLPAKFKKIFREFDILKDLSHPNIIALEKVFWSSDTIYIFQDLVSGGDLFSYLDYKGGILSEIEAASVIRQLLIGIDYLHDNSVVHRDLKPENILMTSLDNATRVVISDFGHARYEPFSLSGRPRRMFSAVGTAGYVAPEIYKRDKAISPDYGYSKSVDLWSAGIITATVLSGEAIFAGSLDTYGVLTRDEAYLSASSRCDLSFLEDEEHYVWSEISPACKDFIRAVILLDAEARLTAEEALSHPWFTESINRRLFDTWYQKAVKDWQPRNISSLLVERLPDVSTESQDSLPRERAITQELVSRHFSSQGQRASPIIPDTDKALDAISEDEEQHHAEQRRPSPQLNASVEEELSSESCTDSMEQLSISGKECGKSNDSVQINASPVDPENSYFAWRENSSIYSFSIPPPPPDSPRYQEDEPTIIPETPVKRVKKVKPATKTLKRLAESPCEHSKMSPPSNPGKKRTVYFTDELAKRRRLPSRYR